MLELALLLIVLGIYGCATPRERTMKEQMELLEKSNIRAKKAFIDAYGYYPSA